MRGFASFESLFYNSSYTFTYFIIVQKGLKHCNFWILPIRGNCGLAEDPFRVIRHIYILPEYYGIDFCWDSRNGSNNGTLYLYSFNLTCLYDKIQKSPNTSGTNYWVKTNN
ncbi:MAG: hypothetical protein LBF02_02990 [Mycoplasmataceae bacterium]|nr:hypothetical protein [Mycoplasmataceae bacterium]